MKLIDNATALSTRSSPGWTILPSRKMSIVGARQMMEVMVGKPKDIARRNDLQYENHERSIQPQHLRRTALSESPACSLAMVKQAVIPAIRWADGEDRKVSVSQGVTDLASSHGLHHVRPIACIRKLGIFRASSAKSTPRSMGGISPSLSTRRCCR